MRRYILEYLESMEEAIGYCYRVMAWLPYGIFQGYQQGKCEGTQKQIDSEKFCTDWITCVRSNKSNGICT